MLYCHQAAALIHYFGTPVTPISAATKLLSGRHGFVSWRRPDQLSICQAVCQSYAADNGAFSAWKDGNPVSDWDPYYAWVDRMARHPAFDFAVIPDVIDGSEADNDALLRAWPLGSFVGVPVWHMHESAARLLRLCQTYPRVALGSSGEFSVVGSPAWQAKMHEALMTVCDANGQPIAKLHGLRMLNPKVFTKLPLASADSTNVARNIGIDQAWKGTYPPPDKEWRAQVMAARTEAHQSAEFYAPRAVSEFFKAA